MYCPGCGLEERSVNQFCRACGADLKRVRTAIETTDRITASAVSARDEIGAAIAGRLREIRSAEEWSTVAEEVLPEIEKFLESPAEKRLRRMRAGMMLSSIGLGVTIGLTIAGFFVNKEELVFLAGLGVVVFFLGIGFLLNGLFLTVPRTGIADRSSDADRQRALDAPSETNELVLPEATSLFNSVTENTTQHLKEKDPISRS